jgi:hypothetical protein
MKVRRGPPNAPQLRDLKRIHVLQDLCWRRVKFNAGDQRPPRIRTDDMGLVRSPAIEDEFSNRVVRGVEFGDPDTDETRAGRYR